MKLVDQIRKLRKFEEISRTDLAEKAGISSHSIASYEQGRVIPTVEVFERILKALGYRAKITKDDKNE